MSRIENAGRNMSWQAVSTVSVALLNFLVRYFFLHYLGAAYLGVEGLFSAIFGVVSFVDIGFSSAFVFCFYKAIAEEDDHHIAVLINGLKKVLRTVMVCILALGLLALPFIQFFIKGETDIDLFHLRLYYLMLLGQTLIGYFYMEKTCYITACQKAYKLVPFTLVASISVGVLQILFLIFTKNYTVFLSLACMSSVLQMIVINRYLMMNFPLLKYKVKEKLSAEDKAIISRNAKGLILGKIGTICVYQTDNIIISACVNVVATGLVANYYSLKTLVSGILSLIQNALVPSMGDFMCKEKKEEQLYYFYTYAMMMSLLIGVAFCGLAILSTPLVTLLFGGQFAIDELSVFLMFVGFQFSFLYYTLNILPMAGGFINIGAYVAAVEGLVNLVVSLIAMKFIGLPGVYFGTAVSGLCTYILKPFSIFPKMFQVSPKRFFIRTIPGILLSILSYGLLIPIRRFIFANGVTVWNFLLMTFLVIIVFFAINIIAFYKDQHFKECVKICNGYLRAVIKKHFG